MPQHHKGDRLQLVARTPVAVGEEVRRLAAAAGLPVSEYITAVLAREVGMPDLAPVPRRRQTSAELPITDVA